MDVSGRICPVDLWPFDITSLAPPSLPQDGLELDENGTTPAFVNLRVRYKEPHLVGNLVNKWDLQVMIWALMMGAYLGVTLG